APDFLQQFRRQSTEHLQPVLDTREVDAILDEFRRLRLSDETIYLRAGSINLINGMIGMNFSCDGTHYIDHKTFYDKLENFCTPEAVADLPAAVACSI
ncbi:MAG: hypothetical protein WBN51_08850, partial [Gammaproteobacteria bacterium]